MKIKNVYPVSLCQNGVLGGLLYLHETEMVYCTNKLTVPERIRRLHLPYSELLNIKKSAFYTVEVSMRNGETYRFLVFSRESLLREIATKMRTHRE